MAAGGDVIELEDGWADIKAAINKLVDILENPETSEPFTTKKYVEVYTRCYNMCTQRSPHNWSEQLYERHGDTIEEYLTARVLPVLQEKRDEYLLKEMVKRWKNHMVMDKWMRRFFMYLDRYFVKHHSVPSLHESSLAKFKSLVFDRVSEELTAGILTLINREREGEVIDRSLLKECIAVYSNVGDPKVYQETLEAPFLENTRQFYSQRAQEWIAQDTTPVYLIKAEEVLDNEKERVDNYLETNTKMKLQKVVEEELLAKHETALLEKEGSGCRALLQDEKKEDLARMFKLFKNVENGLDPIASTVKDFIAKQGEEIVNKRESVLQSAATQKEKDALDTPFVQSLLDLHEKFQKLVREQFENNAAFQKALKEACEVFINHDVGKKTNAELLSSFCDRILKSGGSKKSDTEIENYLERTVQLFSYLSEKDLFAEVYRNQLAKRLLMGRSASDDAERSLISKLKLRCGAQFTAKFEGMVKDLITGEEFKKSFKEKVRTDGNGLLPENAPKDSALSPDAEGDHVSVNGVEFLADVLTTGHWPSYKMVTLTMPQELQLCMDVYENFYNGKTEHRRLKWVHSLGNVFLRAHFKKSYELQVTTLQAVALLQFNTVSAEDWIEFGDMVQRLNTEDEVVKRVMHSLSCAKHKVLLKEPASKTINPSDKFKLNEKFASPMRKLRLPMASLDESHNPKRVQEDRSIAIEAAIVRIMKARKRMAHSALISEVLQQLHFFSPNPRVIKRRIEHLIDREYLERDEDENNFYKYLA